MRLDNHFLAMGLPLSEDHIRIARGRAIGVDASDRPTEYRRPRRQTAEPRGEIKVFIRRTRRLARWVAMRLLSADQKTIVGVIAICLVKLAKLVGTQDSAAWLLLKRRDTPSTFLFVATAPK